MTVVRFNMPVATAFDDIGVTIPGAQLTFFQGTFSGPGTSTKQDTFEDFDLTIKNPNPMIAEDDGRFETIFLQEKLYRVLFEDADDVLIWDHNPVNTEGISSVDVKRLFFFTGDGVTTAFDTLQSNLPTDQINYDISVQGIAQKKDSDTYTISGSVVNFVTAPPNAMLIEIVVFQPVSELFGFSAIPFVGDGSELTISAGAITVTTGFHKVDTEADAATDDLDTINGTLEGQIVRLRAADSSRTIVLKDGTGNLKLPGDVSLDIEEDSITLLNFNGTDLQATADSNNG